MEDSTQRDIIAGCGMVSFVSFFVVVCSAYDLFITSYVLMKLWNWFLPSIGAATVGLVQVMGLRLVAGMIYRKGVVLKPDVDKKKQNEHTITSLLAIFLGPWISLLLGYIVHLYM